MTIKEFRRQRNSELFGRVRNAYRDNDFGFEEKLEVLAYEACFYDFSVE